MVRTALVAQPFDAGRLQLSGDPVRIAEPVGSFLDGAFFSASVNGVLVFRGPDEDRQLTGSIVEATSLAAPVNQVDTAG